MRVSRGAARVRARTPAGSVAEVEQADIARSAGLMAIRVVPPGGGPRALRVYHRGSRPGLAGSGAEEEARLGVPGRDPEGEVASQRVALETREFQQCRDLGRGVEVSLGILDRTGLEKLAHDAPAPLDGVQGELPHDPERALPISTEKDRPRGVPPAENVENEVSSRFEDRSNRVEGRDERGPGNAVEDTAENGHQVEDPQPCKVLVGEISNLEA